MRFTIGPAAKQVATETGDNFMSRIDEIRHSIEQAAETNRAEFGRNLAELAKAQAEEIERLNKVLADSTTIPSREIKQIAMTAAADGRSGGMQTFGLALCSDGSLWRCEFDDHGENWRRVAPLPSPLDEAESKRREDEQRQRDAEKARDLRLQRGW